MPTPIVVLDENDHGPEFLEELFRSIKFLVHPLSTYINRFPPVCKLQEIDTANVESEKYLREALAELVAAGGFRYATTAVRFISPPYNPPSVSEMRFHLLNPEPLTSYAGNGGGLLGDELYERILGDVFRDARVRAPRLQILHTITCIDISVLADLTATNQDTVKRTVEFLHAVLFVSPMMAVCIGTMICFPTLSSLKNERKSTSPSAEAPHH